MGESVLHSDKIGDTNRVGHFERLRARLLGIAYRMLGSVDDANDTIQDVYLRWHETDLAAVRQPEAWLVAVTTRLSIDRARRAEIERMRYIGDWLPEPIATDPSTAPDRQVEIASDLSMAFLVMLERLAPEERAAFLLREVFDAGYDEIARVLEKSEGACRQIVHRARERVRSDRMRFAVAAETKERILEEFIAALEADDQERLLALVSEDATWRTDGGGRVSSVRRTLYGAPKIVRFLRGVERKGRGLVRHAVGWTNDEPVILTYVGDRLYCTTSVATDGERMLEFYRVLNPDKLGHALPAP
jgi:RNA polymerase sigma-70 factor, ECF subfamily